MVYSFGASTGQPRLQFRTEQNWADDAALSRGFMVVDNSLTDSLYNSNRVLERRDADDDEGAHRRHTTARSRTRWATAARAARSSRTRSPRSIPGLLDGIQPSCDYPDSITTGIEVTDCVLLVNFYVAPGMDRR